MLGWGSSTCHKETQQLAGSKMQDLEGKFNKLRATVAAEGIFS